MPVKKFRTKKAKKAKRKGEEHKFILGAIQLKNLFKSKIYFSTNNNGKCHNFTLLLQAPSRNRTMKSRKGFHLNCKEDPRGEICVCSILKSLDIVVIEFFPHPWISADGSSVKCRKELRRWGTGEENIWIKDHNMFLHVPDCNSFVLFYLSSALPQMKVIYFFAVFFPINVQSSLKHIFTLLCFSLVHFFRIHRYIKSRKFFKLNASSFVWVNRLFPYLHRYLAEWIGVHKYKRTFFWKPSTTFVCAVLYSFNL